MHCAPWAIDERLHVVLRQLLAVECSPAPRPLIGLAAALFAAEPFHGARIRLLMGVCAVMGACAHCLDLSEPVIRLRANRGESLGDWRLPSTRVCWTLR